MGCGIFVLSASALVIRSLMFNFFCTLYSPSIFVIATGFVAFSCSACSELNGAFKNLLKTKHFCEKAENNYVIKTG